MKDMKFAAEAVAAAKARLHERMEQRKLERDIKEAVAMVQRRRNLDSVPEAQWEPVEDSQKGNMHTAGIVIAQMLMCIAARDGLFLMALGTVVFLAAEILK